MLEYEWFLSILEKQDMVEIVTQFSIQVQGFDRNISIAPQQRIENAIREYLNNGLKRRKRQALKFNEMLNEIARSMEYDELTLEQFILKVEFDKTIRPYQAIAYLQSKFPTFYEEKKELISLNINNKDFVFKGINDIKSPIEKIKAYIHSNVPNEQVYEKIKSYEQKLEIEGFSTKYNEYREEIKGEEEKLLQKITEVSGNKQTIILLLLAFLSEKNNFKNPEYSFFIFEIEKFFGDKKIKEEENARKKLEHYTAELIKINENLKIQSEEMKKNLEDYSEEIIKTNEDLKTQNQELKKELEQYENVLKENILLNEKLSFLEEEKVKLESKFSIADHLEAFFTHILKEREFVVITDEIKEFNETPFKNYIKERLAFLKDKRANQIEYYKDKILFFTRSSFPTREWGEIKVYLDENNLEYYEVGHLDISSYMVEIIQYLCRKGKEYEFEY